MSTEVPLSRQLVSARGNSELSDDHRKCRKTRIISPHTYLYLLGATIPGVVTNTGITFCVPAGLVRTAVYVPVVAEVAVMVRVKLKEVVPAGELQGLLVV